MNAIVWSLQGQQLLSSIGSTSILSARRDKSCDGVNHQDTAFRFWHNPKISIPVQPLKPDCWNVGSKKKRPTWSNQMDEWLVSNKTLCHEIGFQIMQSSCIANKFEFIFENYWRTKMALISSVASVSIEANNPSLKPFGKKPLTELLDL